MIALLLAAAMQMQPAPPASAVTAQAVLGDRSPLLRGRACGVWDAKPVNRKAPAPKLSKLGDLPPANLEIAVLRLAPNGCSVPVIVRYDAQGDGRFAKAEAAP
jgi:hypothetical protein